MRLLCAVTCAILGLSAGARAEPPHVGDAAESGGAPEPEDRGARDLGELGRGQLIKGTEAQGYVSFTFDDGPSHVTTPQVLDALDRYDVPATFFVVGRRVAGRGEQARKNLEILGEIVRRGHDLGNHTYSHPNLTEIPVDEIKSQIDRNSKILSDRLGWAPHAFRPPFGAITDEGRAHVRQRSMTEVRWSIDTLDFRADRARDLRARTVRRILAERGGVVLMHDTKEVTARNVAGILDDLEAENCRRLGAGEPVIVPVSLHYFMRNRDGSPRPVPEAVAARTRRYLDALPGRCEARTAP